MGPELAPLSVSTSIHCNPNSSNSADQHSRRILMGACPSNSPARRLQPEPWPFPSHQVTDGGLESQLPPPAVGISGSVLPHTELTVSAQSPSNRSGRTPSLQGREIYHQRVKPLTPPGELTSCEVITPERGHQVPGILSCP